MRKIVPVTTPGGRADRQRQLRRNARQRILDAASSLLEEHRWADLRLEDVMAGAGLSRTAFYRHFDDRHALLLAMLDEVRDRVGGTGLAWKNGVGDPVAALCTGLAELADAMAAHGRLMQAIVESSAYDPDIRTARVQMEDRFAEVTADRIRADVATGRSRVRSPDLVAEALVRMNESVLLEAFGRPPYPDRDEVVATICEVWIATVYGRDALDAYAPPAPVAIPPQRST